MVVVHAPHKSPVVAVYDFRPFASGGPIWAMCGVEKYGETGSWQGAGFLCLDFSISSFREQLLQLFNNSLFRPILFRYGIPICFKCQVV